MFGISSSTCALLWDKIHVRAPSELHQKHVLWGLMLMKVYASESVLASLAGCTQKTFRKWSKAVVELIGSFAPDIVS